MESIFTAVINKKRNKKKLFAKFNSIPFGILLINSEQRIYFANNQALHFTGYRDLTGLNCDVLFSNENNFSPPLKSEENIEGKVIDMRLNDGTILPVLKTVQPLILNDEKYQLEMIAEVATHENTKELLLEKSNELNEILNLKLRSDKKALIESKKFELLFNEISDSLFLHDLEGNILKVNRSAVFCFGYSMSELCSMNIRDLVSEDLLNSIDDNVKLLIKRGNYSFETVHITNNNVEIPVIVSSKIIKLDGKKLILSSVKDITVQKNSEAKLIGSRNNAEENEAELKAIFDNSPISIFVFDQQLRVLRINRKGLSKFQVHDFCFEKLRLGNIINCVNTENNTLKCGSTENCKSCRLNTIFNLTVSNEETFFKEEVQVSFRKKKKIIEKTMLISTSQLKQNGQTTFLAMLDDISRRKKMERELIKAKEKAEQSDRLKTAFLNNISHEIRTPLNGILGFIDFFGENELNRFSEDQRREFIMIMKKSGDRLINTVNDLVEISKLDSGSREMKKEKFNVSDELTVLIGNTKDGKINPNINFIAEVNPDIQNYLAETDKGSLLQILKHLLDNAFKFTNEGFVKLIVSAENSDLICKVEDSGIGIKDCEQEMIFKPFGKSIDSIKNAVDGNGLGLSISQKLANSLGGDLIVQSTFGSGSVFTLTLPNVFVSSQKKTPESYTQMRSEIDLKGKTILVAEDEMSNFLYIQAVLNNKGCNIIHAKNGKEAVENCLNGHKPDLVLMDLKMPVMDGFTAAQKIRETGKNIPVIAHSAFVLNNEKQLATDAGCIDYLPKPVKQQDLIDMILRYVKVD